MEDNQSVKRSPDEIANWFLCHIDREAGDSITPLKLQKLVYYAQCWALVFLGDPIFDDDFEAWSHGPVLPGLYDRFRDYGYQSIPSCDCENTIDGDLEEVLLEVRRVYGEKSGKVLEELTHMETPWIEARADLEPEVRCNTKLSKTTMKKYYSDLLYGNGQG